MKALLLLTLFLSSTTIPDSQIWCSKSGQMHAPSAFKNYFTGSTSDYKGVYQVTSQSGEMLHIIEIGINDGQWFASKRVYNIKDAMPAPTFLKGVNILNSEFRTDSFNTKLTKLEAVINGRRRKLHGFVLDGLFYCKNE